MHATCIEWSGCEFTTFFFSLYIEIWIVSGNLNQCIPIQPIHSRGLRWPRGKVLNSEPEVTCWKLNSTEDLKCMGQLHAKSYIAAKRLPAGVVWKLGEGDASSGVILVI
ncbi:hypothetical protein AVEN_30400-1 [Araneus ventricosus]|uniref:Uncharacterized protein n=1 Tax=Araneus ventricosus TaxID=182803 RepID=A0A4Y2FLK8_ARAVE|nr:hypothetical protein AVEN_30400-1 [Araneus ventricosus]